MELLSQITISEPSGEGGLKALGAVALVGLLGWAILRKFLEAPTTPDPWSDEVAKAMESEDAVPLCPHCLEPHGSDALFCRDCGGPVGAYVNVMPFLYLFSVGHLMRIGTSENFKRSYTSVIGFFLFSFAEYTIFAPFYWIMLLKNLSRIRRSKDPGDSPAAQTIANS